MADYPFLTDLTSNARFIIPAMTLDPVSFNAGAEEIELLSNKSLIVGSANWDTGRALRPMRWSMTIPAFRNPPGDEGMSTGRLRSLFQQWLNTMRGLKLEAPELLPLVLEPLQRMTTTVFCGSLGWWATGEDVYLDGVLQTEGYTVDADSGTVTFAVAPGSDAVVTCSVDRAPQVRVVALEATPMAGELPLRYALRVTLREDSV